jgi:hypothetical protein
MQPACHVVQNMKLIQIRNVPDETHRALKGAPPAKARRCPI